MKRSSRTRVVCIFAALLCCAMADGLDRHGDRYSTAEVNACLAESGSLTESSIAPNSCCVIRAIEDPGTRQTWLLVRDLDRPAGPALLIQIRTTFAARIKGRSELQTALPIIRPGDRLIVSEKTAVSEGRFDATALNAAAVGEAVTVRLKLGGSILHALATAPGRANLVAAQSEAGQ